MKTNKAGIDLIKSWATVRGPNDCWDYKGGDFVFSKGGRLKYGRVWLDKKRWRVHRLAAVLSGMNVTKSSVVCHRCDNTLCINPSHLFVGTAAQNMADKMAKGRHRVTRGESHPLSTISDEQVLEIKVLALRGVRQKDIAGKFGISQPLVSMIKNGKTRVTANENK